MGVHARARKCKNHVYTLRDALRPTYCDHRQHTQTKVILTRTCSHKRLQAATHRLHSHAFTLFKVQAHKSTSNHKREWKHTHSYLRRRIHTVTCTHGKSQEGMARSCGKTQKDSIRRFYCTLRESIQCGVHEKSWTEFEKIMACLPEKKSLLAGSRA